jgi:hypothetical protein
MEPPDLKALFTAALERPAGPERSAYLDQACRDDDDLRARIEALLRAHEQAGSFLQPAIHTIGSEVAVDTLGDPDGPAIADPTLTQPFTEGPGSCIGPYKLLQRMGEGGMGVVYMAEQERPVRRKVALKIIKPGMDSQQVIARFEAEWQALALMAYLRPPLSCEARTPPMRDLKRDRFFSSC